ncbi:hypothetical protein NW768_003174 [Fusarium equiseti]|uniref:Glutamine amidotransferase type-2 domain-containing protein n=1 Tax=Fusarium equiseti TaxID=61235 RepID=A0ABQ8RLB0_FUSEQ|nr:hypothetical protein NW768_003174 [Fusarium equiseti]
MCGIHASITTSFDKALSAELERCLCNRGPDHTGTVKTQLDNGQGELFLTFTSTVLSLRGDHVAKQPLVDRVTESVLCWNGEAWAIRGEPVQGNDGEAILALLAKASQGSGDVTDVLRAIEGPFAFIYLDKPAKRLYYGRDRLGRRSLLVKDGLPFTLSSIADTPVEGWTEVEADGYYTLELSVDASGGLLPERHDWTADETSLVNVPYAENLEHRPEVVRLIYPHNTEMDLSIACALYFAARGRGLGETNIESTPQPYSTTARVLLSGLGADELFGGYGRHGVAYTRGGYAGVVKELKLDVSRLGKRNLGRDDRAMSHWGREVRFPYLDERFVKWAIESPVWEKCDFENPGGEGSLDAEKRVLRLVAQFLGMKTVSREKKRAIQFGARTAKMESGKTKGTTLLS